MQRWEYLVVGPVKYPQGKGFSGHYPQQAFFTPEGLLQSDIPGKGQPQQEANNLAATIARLGDEGWEMVGCGPYQGVSGTRITHGLYFKRPK